MPQVNLSTLSGPELRQLLDTTRQRGEAALSYRILQEMADRRQGAGRRGLFQMRRPTEARNIAVDLGDPMDRGDDDVPPMPHWRPPSLESKAPSSLTPEPAAGPEPRRSRRRKTQSDPTMEAAVTPVAPADAEPMPPLGLETAGASLDEAEGSKDWREGLPPLVPENPRAPWRISRGLAAGFAAGAAVGITFGLWMGGISRVTPSSPPASAPAAIRTAALVRPPAPATAPATATAAEPEPEPAPEAPPETTVAPPAPDIHEAALSPPDNPEVAHEAAGVAMELPANPPEHRKAEAVRTAEAPKAVLAQAAPAAVNPCAAEPTPADREICGDPELQGLQRELRQAYAKALEAHEDRALLRQRQLAWANARDTVSDSDQLARLYEQRIRKLNAATAEARQQR